MGDLKVEQKTQFGVQTAPFHANKKAEKSVTNLIDFSFTKDKKNPYEIEKYQCPILAEKEPKLKPTKWSKYEATVMKATGLSQDCLEHIMANEGVMLDMYRCDAHRRTIGIGHNIDADKNYKFGNKITPETAFYLFTQDLLEVGRNLDTLTGGRKLTQGQKDALTDIVFNVGAQKLEGSNLMNLIKEGKFDEAIQEFNYIRAGNKVNIGLIKRRMGNVVKFAEGSNLPSAIKSINNFKEKALKAYDERIRHCKKKADKNIYHLRKLNIINYSSDLKQKVVENLIQR